MWNKIYPFKLIEDPDPTYRFRVNFEFESTETDPSLRCSLPTQAGLRKIQALPYFREGQALVGLAIAQAYLRSQSS